MRIFPSKDNFPLEQISEAMLSPIAVLKELIENAIDSGATAIKISVEDNCMGKITVADNGCGIDFTDAKYLLKEGFSSKVKDMPLQNGAYPLGYRGKSLFAISSLSKIKIASKCIGGQGFELTGNLGLNEIKKTYLEKNGTIVQITNLYFQEEPLREKYKADAQLKSLINRCVIDYALGCEDISFQYTVGGKTVLSKPACPLKEALQHIFGATLSSDMIKDIDWSYGGITLSGVTALLQEKASSPYGGYSCLSVQGRRINDDILNKTIRDVFRYYFLTSKLPFYFIKIQIPAKEVSFDNDAAKQTATFVSQQALCECVKECLSKSLFYQYRDQKRRNLIISKGKTINQFVLKEEEDKPLVFARPKKALEGGETLQEQNLYDFEKLLFLQRNRGNHNLKANTFVNTKVLGMLFDRFIIAERGEFFYFIDYYSARALFYYDNYMEQIDNQTLTVSKLFNPLAFKLRESFAVFFDNCQNQLKEAGFVFSKINEMYYRLDAIPAIFMGVLDCQAFLNGIVTHFYDCGTQMPPKEIASKACDCLKFNTENLTLLELKSFVKDFEGKRFRKTPKGDEIVVVYTASDLRKRFGGKEA